MAKKKNDKRRNLKNKAPDSVQEASQPVILHRVRHADPATRHAALVALLHSNKINEKILAAVRERVVVDTDLNCAIVASQILANVASTAAVPDEVSAPWLIVLVHRLKTASSEDLALPLLQAICRLLENNPLAMERLIPQPPYRDSECRKDTLTVLVSFLNRPYSMTLAARGLHAILQDANEVWIPLHQEDPMLAQHILTSLQHVQNSSVTQLHAIGCLASIDHLSVQHITFLRESLVWNPDYARVIQAFKAYQQEKEDFDMEESVLKAQADNNEPARQIARRLKEHEQEAARRRQEESYEQIWVEAESSWLSIIEPFDLALEITANLIHDDMDGDTRQFVIQNGIPEHVWYVMGQLLLAPTDLPPSIQETVILLQRKATIVITHSLLHLTQWNPPKSLWSDMVKALEISSSDAKDALSACLVIAVHSRPDTRKYVQSSDLDFFLDILSNPEESPYLLRDIISLLGTLCSNESHSEDVNIAVSRSLIQVGHETKSSVVLAEVLDALMDIFGNDECHQAVFESLNVIYSFKIGLQKLKNLSKLQDEDFDETIQNASRFIDYKKRY